MPFTKNETLLVFRIAGIPFAVPAESVGSILMPPPHITHTPGSARSTPGIFHHAEYTYAVIDLHERFGIDIPRKGSGRLLLHEDGIRHFAFLVDEVVGLIRSEQGQWANLPTYLPQELFPIGFLYLKEIVLCSELPLLRNMHDIEPLRHHFKQLRQQLETSKATQTVSGQTKGGATETKTASTPTIPEKEIKPDTAIPHTQPQSTASADTVSQKKTSASVPATPTKESKPDTAIPHTLPQSTASADTVSQKKTSASVPATPTKESKPDTAIPHTPPQKPVFVDHSTPETKSTTHSTDSQPEPDSTKISAHGTTKTTTPPRATTSAESRPLRQEPLKTAVTSHTSNITNDSKEPATHSYSPRPTTPPPATQQREPAEPQSDNTLLWLLLFLLLLCALPIAYWLWPQPSHDRLSPPVTMERSPPVVVTEKFKPPVAEQPVPATEPESVVEQPASEAPEQPVEPDTAPPLRIERDADGTVNVIIDRQAASKEITAQSAPAAKPESESVAQQAATETQDQTLKATTSLEKKQLESCDCTHIVVKGDTLWDIAEQYTGDAFNYPELAKRSGIKNPDRIYPGDRVRIIIR